MTLQQARETIAESQFGREAGQVGTPGQVEQLAWATAMVAGAGQAGVEEYRRGFCDGVRAYAYTSSEQWAESGTHYVGTTGRTLAEALERVEETHNYAPGQTILR